MARVVSSEPGAPDESGSLRSARVVVGAGRGAGSADGFDAVIELADLLGGTLGVSRVVTSLGWRPADTGTSAELNLGSPTRTEIDRRCGE